MTEHILKTWPEHYAAIERGAKTCELRLNDRPYAVGDALLLKEFEPLGSQYTGQQLRVRVTHIINGGPWLAPGYLAMSIRLMAEDNAKQVNEDWKLVADRQRETHKDLVALCTGILECLDQGDLWTKPARKHAAGLLRTTLAKVNKS